MKTEDGASKKFTPDYLSRLLADVTNLKQCLEETKCLIGSLDGSYIEYEEFLKLYENTGELVRLTSGMLLADEIIRIFFSKFTATGQIKGPNGKQKQWSVTDHCFREPFDKLVENGQYSVWSG